MAKEEKKATGSTRILPAVKSASITGLFLTLTYADGTTEVFALHTADGHTLSATAVPTKESKAPDKKTPPKSSKKDDDEDEDDDDDEDEDDDDEDADDEDEDDDDEDADDEEDDDDEDEDKKKKKKKK